MSSLNPVRTNKSLLPVRAGGSRPRFTSGSSPQRSPKMNIPNFNVRNNNSASPNKSPREGNRRVHFEEPAQQSIVPTQQPSAVLQRSPYGFRVPQGTAFAIAEAGVNGGNGSLANGGLIEPGRAVTQNNVVVNNHTTNVSVNHHTNHLNQHGNAHTSNPNTSINNASMPSSSSSSAPPAITQSQFQAAASSSQSQSQFQSADMRPDLNSNFQFSALLPANLQTRAPQTETLGLGFPLPENGIVQAAPVNPMGNPNQMQNAPRQSLLNLGWPGYESDPHAGISHQMPTANYNINALGGLGGLGLTNAMPNNFQNLDGNAASHMPNSNPQAQQAGANPGFNNVNQPQHNSNPPVRSAASFGNALLQAGVDLGNAGASVGGASSGAGASGSHPPNPNGPGSNPTTPRSASGRKNISLIKAKPSTLRVPKSKAAGMMDPRREALVDKVVWNRNLLYNRVCKKRATYLSGEQAKARQEVDKLIEEADSAVADARANAKGRGKSNAAGGNTNSGADSSTASEDELRRLHLLLYNLEEKLRDAPKARSRRFSFNNTKDKADTSRSPDRGSPVGGKRASSPAGGAAPTPDELESSRVEETSSAETSNEAAENWKIQNKKGGGISSSNATAKGKNNKKADKKASAPENETSGSSSSSSDEESSEDESSSSDGGGADQRTVTTEFSSDSDETDGETKSAAIKNGLSPTTKNKRESFSFVRNFLRKGRFLAGKGKTGKGNSPADAADPATPRRRAPQAGSHDVAAKILERKKKKRSLNDGEGGGKKVDTSNEEAAKTAQTSGPLTMADLVRQQSGESPPPKPEMAKPRTLERKPSMADLVKSQLESSPKSNSGSPDKNFKGKQRDNDAKPKPATATGSKTKRVIAEKKQEDEKKVKENDKKLSEAESSSDDSNQENKREGHADTEDMRRAAAILKNKIGVEKIPLIGKSIFDNIRKPSENDRSKPADKKDYFPKLEEMDAKRAEKSAPKNEVLVPVAAEKKELPVTFEALRPLQTLQSDESPAKGDVSTTKRKRFRIFESDLSTESVSVSPERRGKASAAGVHNEGNANVTVKDDHRMSAKNIIANLNNQNESRADANANRPAKSSPSTTSSTDEDISESPTVAQESPVNPVTSNNQISSKKGSNGDGKGVGKDGREDKGNGKTKGEGKMKGEGKGKIGKESARAEGWKGSSGKDTGPSPGKTGGQKGAAGRAYERLLATGQLRSPGSSPRKKDTAKESSASSEEAENENEAAATGKKESLLKGKGSGKDSGKDHKGKGQKGHGKGTSRERFFPDVKAPSGKGGGAEEAVKSGGKGNRVDVNQVQVEKTEKESDDAKKVDTENPRGTAERREDSRDRRANNKRASDSRSRRKDSRTNKDPRGGSSRSRRNDDSRRRGEGFMRMDSRGRRFSENHRSPHGSYPNHRRKSYDSRGRRDSQGRYDSRGRRLRARRPRGQEGRGRFQFGENETDDQDAREEDEHNHRMQSYLERRKGGLGSPMKVGSPTKRGTGRIGVNTSARAAAQPQAESPPASPRTKKIREKMQLLESVRKMVEGTGFGDSLTDRMQAVHASLVGHGHVGKSDAISDAIYEKLDASLNESLRTIVLGSAGGGHAANSSEQKPPGETEASLPPIQAAESKAVTSPVAANPTSPRNPRHIKNPRDVKDGRRSRASSRASPSNSDKDCSETDLSEVKSARREEKRKSRVKGKRTHNSSKRRNSDASTLSGIETMLRTGRVLKRRRSATTMEEGKHNSPSDHGTKGNTSPTSRNSQRYTSHSNRPRKRSSQKHRRRPGRGSRGASSRNKSTGQARESGGRKPETTSTSSSGDRSADEKKDDEEPDERRSDQRTARDKARDDHAEKPPNLKKKSSHKTESTTSEKKKGNEKESTKKHSKPATLNFPPGVSIQQSAKKPVEANTNTDRSPPGQSSQRTATQLLAQIAAQNATSIQVEARHQGASATSVTHVPNPPRNHNDSGSQPKLANPSTETTGWSFLNSFAAWSREKEKKAKPNIQNANNNDRTWDGSFPANSHSFHFADQNSALYSADEIANRGSSETRRLFPPASASLSSGGAQRGSPEPRRRPSMVTPTKFSPSATLAARFCAGSASFKNRLGLQGSPGVVDDEHEAVDAGNRVVDVRDVTIGFPEEWQRLERPVAPSAPAVDTRQDGDEEQVNNNIIVQKTAASLQKPKSSTRKDERNSKRASTKAKLQDKNEHISEVRVTASSLPAFDESQDTFYLKKAAVENEISDKLEVFEPPPPFHAISFDKMRKTKDPLHELPHFTKHLPALQLPIMQDQGCGDSTRSLFEKCEGIVSGMGEQSRGVNRMMAKWYGPLILLLVLGTTLLPVAAASLGVVHAISSRVWLVSFLISLLLCIGLQYEILRRRYRTLLHVCDCFALHSLRSHRSCGLGDPDDVHSKHQLEKAHDNKYLNVIIETLSKKLFPDPNRRDSLLLPVASPRRTVYTAGAVVAVLLFVMVMIEAFSNSGSNTSENPSEMIGNVILAILACCVAIWGVGADRIFADGAGSHGGMSFLKPRSMSGRSDAPSSGFLRHHGMKYVLPTEETVTEILNVRLSALEIHFNILIDAINRAESCQDGDIVGVVRDLCGGGKDNLLTAFESSAFSVVSNSELSRQQTENHLWGLEQDEKKQMQKEQEERRLAAEQGIVLQKQQRIEFAKKEAIKQKQQREEREKAREILGKIQLALGDDFGNLNEQLKEIGRGPGECETNSDYLLEDNFLKALVRTERRKDGSVDNKGSNAIEGGKKLMSPVEEGDEEDEIAQIDLSGSNDEWDASSIEDVADKSIIDLVESLDGKGVVTAGNHNANREGWHSAVHVGGGRNRNAVGDLSLDISSAGVQEDLNYSVYSDCNMLMRKQKPNAAHNLHNASTSVPPLVRSSLKRLEKFGLCCRVSIAGSLEERCVMWDAKRFDMNGAVAPSTKLSGEVKLVCWLPISHQVFLIRDGMEVVGVSTGESDINSAIALANNLNASVQPAASTTLTHSSTPWQPTPWQTQSTPWDRQSVMSAYRSSTTGATMSTVASTCDHQSLQTPRSLDLLQRTFPPLRGFSLNETISSIGINDSLMNTNTHASSSNAVAGCSTAAQARQQRDTAFADELQSLNMEETEASRQRSALETTVTTARETVGADFFRLFVQIPSLKSSANSLGDLARKFWACGRGDGIHCSKPIEDQRTGIAASSSTDYVCSVLAACFAPELSIETNSPSSWMEYYQLLVKGMWRKHLNDGLLRRKGLRTLRLEVGNENTSGTEDERSDVNVVGNSSNNSGGTDSEVVIPMQDGERGRSGRVDIFRIESTEDGNARPGSKLGGICQGFGNRIGNGVVCRIDSVSIGSVVLEFETPADKEAAELKYRSL